MEDRRIFARISKKLPLRFLSPGKQKESEAQTLDISAHGLGILTEEELSKRTPLELWLDIPDQHEPLYTRGEVVWSLPLSGTTQHRTGVRLEKAELMGLARVLWK